MTNLRAQTLQQGITRLLEDKELRKRFMKNPKTLRCFFCDKDIPIIENMFKVDIQDYSIKIGGPWFGACSL